MGIFTKESKEEKVVEPQYYLSATNMQTLNYKVYYMSKTEKILYFLLAFAVGAAVGYVFYGGLAKDDYGQATTMTYILDVVICGVVGFLAGKMFLPIRTNQIIAKRRKELNQQFRDMLDGLTTSLGAGNNVRDSFAAVRDDLQVQYEEDAYILKELDIILSGLQNNINIEDMLEDFGNRSGIDDIKSFAEVFKVSYRKGGNIQHVIKNTHGILSDKMEISEDIETVLTANKNEQNIMLFMPVVMVALIKSISPEFAANFATPTGIGATTVAIVMFVISYYVGKKVLDINV